MAVAPWPGTLSRTMAPPALSTIALQMASPRPVPPVLRLREGSPREKRSKTCGRSAGSTPSPWSSIRNSTEFNSVRTDILTSVRGGLCCRAFSSRLEHSSAHSSPERGTSAGPSAVSVSVTHRSSAMESNCCAIDAAAAARSDGPADCCPVVGCSARASVNMRATISSIRSQSTRLTSMPAAYSSVVRCRIASSCSDDLTTATAVFSSCAASLTKRRCCEKDVSRRCMAAESAEASGASSRVSTALSGG